MPTIIIVESRINFNELLNAVDESAKIAQLTKSFEESVYLKEQVRLLNQELNDVRRRADSGGGIDIIIKQSPTGGGGDDNNNNDDDSASMGQSENNDDLLGDNKGQERNVLSIDRRDPNPAIEEPPFSESLEDDSQLPMPPPPPLPPPPPPSIGDSTKVTSRHSYYGQLDEAQLTPVMGFSFGVLVTQKCLLAFSYCLHLRARCAC